MTSTPALVLVGARLPGRATTVELSVAAGRVEAVAPSLPRPDGVEVVELAGRVVIPGLWDAHAHVGQWALARRRLDLSAATSAGAATATVATAVADWPADELLVGCNMRSALWPDEPRRELLDAVAGDVAVVLQNVDHHMCWLNTAALRRFGRTDVTSGVLREAECYAITEALEEVTTRQLDDWVDDAMAAAAARGLTGVKDYEFGDAVVEWQRRLAERPAHVRVDTTVYPDRLDDAIDRGWVTDEAVPGTDGLLRAGHLKVFVDGALNSRTALCHDPYPGAGVDATAAGGRHGHLATAPEQLQALMAHAWKHGIASAVHAIGDRAVGIALDAFETVGCPGRIEHAQLVAPDDLPRFARSDLVAGVQPAHATDDRDVADRLWPGRTGRAYPFADLVAAGARLELGSDAPVSPLDPWAAIASAVTRTDDDRPAWHPEQRIPVTAALAACARGRDRIRAGEPADLVVLDDDPTTCTAATLREGPVWATMLAGRFTHGGP